MSDTPLTAEELDGWAEDCLTMIAATLEAIGCRHPNASHKDTPPMMYDDWVRCAVGKREDLIATLTTRAEQAEARVVELEAFAAEVVFDYLEMHEYDESVGQCQWCLWIPGSDWRGPHDCSAKKWATDERVKAAWETEDDTEDGCPICDGGNGTPCNSHFL